MNFLPLWTAMVWPIISGTTVERRDQVLTTFFSLREFRPSTFSRRWPSTNGPFLSERAIARLFLHAAQTAPRGAPQLLEAAHRSGNAMRFGTERTNKARAEGVGDALDDDRPAGLAKLVEHGLRRRKLIFPQEYGPGGGLGGRAFGPLDGPGSALGAQGRSACWCPSCACCSHWFCSQPAGLKDPRVSGFRTALPRRSERPASTCGARRCTCRCACCDASSCRASGKPTEFAGDFPSRGLLHRRADGPRDSWPRREPWGECRANGYDRLFRE